jgi:hypothetical protein
MWGDEKPTSDLDISEVYVVPTKTILEGRPYDKTRPQTKSIIAVRDVETTYWEVGHLVGQLLKGNQNAIWAVCSPKVLWTCPEHRVLDVIVRENVAKCTYHSIKGMATSQWKDATKRGLGIKGIRSAWRTANFGCDLLTFGTVAFNRTPDWVDEEALTKKMYLLDQAYESSMLPEKPNPEPFYEFMYNLRLNR